MSIIKKRKFWFILSGFFFVISLLSLLTYGINFGIDFTGGAYLELSFKQPPSITEVSEVVKTAGGIESLTSQPLGDDHMIFRFRDVDEATHQKILASVNEKFKDAGMTEERFNSVGPSVGAELKQKTVKAVILACLLIILFIAYAFRKVSKPVASWKYGVIAIVALIHDIAIVLGTFSILGKFYNMEINAPFIAALLTVLGYSVNDTIVIFDRIRENLMKYFEGDLESMVDKSINEVVTRSVFTSSTVILVLFAILIFGGNTIRDFSLALIVGITAGTYSSIFIASPLLIEFNNWSKRQKKQ